MATTKYSPQIIEKLGYVFDAVQVLRKGATDQAIAEYLGISKRTVTSWKRRYPEFLRSIVEINRDLDDGVEQSLSQRAIGYSRPEEKVFVSGGQVVKVTTKKHYPPDVPAIVYWLRKRRPDRWK